MMRRIPRRARTWGLIGMMLMGGALLAMSAVAAQTAPVSIQQVAMGQSSTFSGMGFLPNESLSLWMTGPDKSVTPLPGNRSDSHGNVTVSVSFTTNGFWQVTAHGVNSDKEVIEGFNVGDAAAATGSASVIALATVSGTVTETAVAGAPPGAVAVGVNQATTFKHPGFQNGERISLWTTGPDGKVSPLDGVVADADGNVIVAVSFPTNGYWQLTAHGLSSSKEVIGGFAVGDLSAAVTAPPPTGTVAPTNAGGIIPSLPATAAATQVPPSPPTTSTQLNTSTAATIQAALGGRPGNAPMTTPPANFTVGPAATPSP